MPSSMSFSAFVGSQLPTGSCAGYQLRLSCESPCQLTSLVLPLSECASAGCGIPGSSILKHPSSRHQQALQPCSVLTAALPAQGVVGETYNRMLVGEAANDPNSEFYLPDDYVFRGKGAEADYLIDGYFSETANTMFGKVWPLHFFCALSALLLIQF